MEKGYLETDLTYTSDGNLLDEYGRFVMMEWEKDWMQESAKVICKNGGDILNIGFGMGLIDSFIQQHNPKSHWIIEPHPIVFDKIKKDGWLNKENVNVLFSKWQDVIDDLPQFDGIYIDTWKDNGFYDLFLPKLHKILKPNGIFSFWNRDTNLNSLIEIKNILKSDFDINYVEINLSNIPKQQYWSKSNKNCIIPIITHSTRNIIKTII